MAKNGLESNPLWQMIEEIAQGGSATVEAPEQRNAITKDIYEAHLKHV